MRRAGRFSWAAASPEAWADLRFGASSSLPVCVVKTEIIAIYLCIPEFLSRDDQRYGGGTHSCIKYSPCSLLLLARPSTTAPPPLSSLKSFLSRNVPYLVSCLHCCESCSWVVALARGGPTQSCDAHSPIECSERAMSGVGMDVSPPAQPATFTRCMVSGSLGPDNCRD